MASASVIANKRVDFTKCELSSPLQTGAITGNNKAIRTIMSDLRPVINRLVVYENIFSPVLTGELFIIDNASLTSTIPLMGIEQVNIGFSATDAQGNVRYYGNSSPITFAVYNQTNRMPVNQGTEQYRLGLVSPELFKLTEKRVSKAYKDVPIEDVVRDLLMSPTYCGTKKSFADIEHTGVTTHFVIPYLAPLDAIKLAVTMGRSSSADTNYAFYETLTGFHFASIRKMIRDGHTKSGTMPVITMGLAGSSPTKMGANDLHADAIDIVTGFDFLQQLSHGAFSSTTVGIDILSGKYQHTIATANDESFKNRMLVDGPAGVSAYPAALGVFNPTGKMFLVPTTSISAANTAMTALDSTIRDNFIETTVQGRNRELLSLASRCVRVRVTGAPELQSGTLVRINVPTPLNNNMLVPAGKDIASGVYLILSAKHELINTGDGNFVYETTFEAYSDSYSR